MTEGAKAAALALLVGAVCLAFAPYAAWLTKYPDAWTLPITDWVTVGLGSVLDFIKPAMRWISWALSFPMEGANWLLKSTPWPLIVGLTTAIGWWIGGWRMAALGFFGLIFVLLTGYWIEGMATLALVFVSVPLALALGLGIGLLAYEVPRARGGIQAVLDFMQTMPTFAYLTPLLLLFGFGPVVGLIASAIYAAPPMARNVLLGLDRVESEIKEAAVMSGGTRIQQLFLVELPSAASQIAVGLNQSLMAALSMVIIAAVIGGFGDIGWEVLLTMRKSQFGPSLTAGMVIVVFAIIIDRMSGALALERQHHDRRVFWALIAASVGAAFLVGSVLPGATDVAAFEGVKAGIDGGLTSFTQAYGAGLDTFKNNAMFFVLLPLRIGLDEAVLPFTWGFAWTSTMSAWVFVAAGVIAAGLAFSGRVVLGLSVAIALGVLETGVSQLPWPFVFVGVAALGWVAGGWRLAALVTGLLTLILLAGLWERALLSLYLCGAAVLACAVLGGALGLLSAVSNVAWAVIRPVCDMLQTIPLFVFLIPVLMFFQIGEFSAFLAIIAYAIVPMIRYTRHGLVTTPPEMLEAAVSAGATDWQILREVRAPYAAPTILLGLNQTILYAFAMLVIAALIGTTGLGQSIYIALGRADVGLGITAGVSMAILALIADRLVQGFAEERRKALGL
ncbi:MAG: ABC transporter permease subunit [Pseudomonadota bacterium]